MPDLPPVARNRPGCETPGQGPAAPLILTLSLDPELEARFERERRQHFPEDRNIVPAHVSLFHNLPDEAADAIAGQVVQTCRVTPVFAVHVTGVMSLGRGTAYRLACPAELHTTLASAWRHWLTQQDRQAWRPHVTVQNKVTPAVARALHGQLARDFLPFGGEARGVRLWRYLNGPWSLMAEVPFTG